MSGNAIDSGIVNLSALASIGSNFSIRLCPTDSPLQTVCHFRSPLLPLYIGGYVPHFYVFLNDAIIYHLLFPRFRIRPFFCPAVCAIGEENRRFISSPISFKRWASPVGISPVGSGVNPRIRVAFRPTDFSYLSIRTSNG